MIQLRLLSAVYDDVAAAARWYDEEGYQGLGDRFINIFYSYLFFIQRPKFSSKAR